MLFANTEAIYFYNIPFRYQWTAGNAGTHFWHAHTGLQKMDGLYGSVIVRQPPSKDPNSNLYDYDLTTHVALISDWMHEDAAERFPGRLAVNVGQDPETVLINGKGQFRVSFGRGKEKNNDSMRWKMLFQSNRYKIRDCILSFLFSL